MRLVHLNEFSNPYGVTPPNGLAFEWDGEMIEHTVIKSQVEEHVVIVLLRANSEKKKTYAVAALNIVDGIGNRRVLDDTTVYISFYDYSNEIVSRSEDSWVYTFFRIIDNNKRYTECPNALFVAPVPIHSIW